MPSVIEEEYCRLLLFSEGNKVLKMMLDFEDPQNEVKIKVRSKVRRGWNQGRAVDSFLTTEKLRIAKSLVTFRCGEKLICTTELYTTLA